MSFFIRKKTPSSDERHKSKTPGRSKGKTNNKDDNKAKKKRFMRNVEISSESDEEISDDEERKRKYPELSSSEDEAETAQEKRLRLAKQYLAKIESEELNKDDDLYEGTDEAISARLKQDILEQGGKLQKNVASSYLPPSSEDITVCRGHQLSVTCVVISSDDKHMFSASKDCSIIKWCVTTGKKVKVVPGGRKGTESKHKGHTAHVLCLAITTDNKFLASGDRNKLILVWNPETCDLLHTFTGHRDVVSGLAFRRGTHQLFSASHDRLVKIWNVDELAYVETLFGHHDVVTAIDSLTRERALTSGGRDGSIRIWKVIEESQLVFNGHRGSIDCVALINEEHFLSGAEDNSLALWTVLKKSPICMVKQAHSGQDPEATGGSAHENWITAVASYSHTDLVASGSKDGSIKLWKCREDFRQMTPVLTIPMVGFVNSLKFSTDGSFLVAGIGQEHRLGRWWRFKQAKNSVCIIRFQCKPIDRATLYAQKSKPGKKRGAQR